MASFDEKMVRLMASKLNIHSNCVIRKTSELLRLLQLRTSATGGIRLSEVSRTVLCLDLACSAVGVPFSKEEGIRLSGVTKKVYSNGYHTIEKLLDLSVPPSIPSISVLLGVGEISSFASKLLNKYVELQSLCPAEKRKVVDLSLPMYYTAAIYIACRSHKVKVDQGKLLDISRIKRIDFKKLADEFQAVADQVDKGCNKLSSKRSNTLMDLVEKHSRDAEKEKAAEKEEKQEVEEDFEAWKKRLLGGSEE